jgi:hypothetical protein
LGKRQAPGRRAINIQKCDDFRGNDALEWPAAYPGEAGDAGEGLAENGEAGITIASWFQLRFEVPGLNGMITVGQGWDGKNDGKKIIRYEIL